jgi:uroporphyrinogen-III synthase
MVNNKKLALITRPVIDAKQVKEKLGKQEIDSFIEPLLTINYYPNASKVIRPYLDSCQAIVATSANAVRAIGYTPKKIIAVGEKTAQTAREVGYEDVSVAGGDVDSLEKYIEENLNPKDGVLLYISGDVTSGDFKPFGFKIMRVVVYSSIPVNDLSDDCQIKLKNKEFDYVVLFSKRTADVFARLAGNYDLKSTICFCLSEKIKQSIESLNFKDIIISKNFDEETVLELV